LDELRRRDPLSHDLILAGINKSRHHKGIEPLDPNEWAHLQNRKDVLPAQMARIEDEIEALEAKPKGFLARAKRALSSSYKREQRIEDLRAQLQVFDQEEKGITERLGELRLMEAA
jgi:predicted  nucleic acid-binding Zn-ribbon protein